MNVDSWASTGLATGGGLAIAEGLKKWSEDVVLAYFSVFFVDGVDGVDEEESAAASSREVESECVSDGAGEILSERDGEGLSEGDGEGVAGGL